MPEDNENLVTIKCNTCDVAYHIKWEDDDHEPSSCPFCGADTSIEEEDAIFDNEQEEDDWN